MTQHISSASDGRFRLVWKSPGASSAPVRLLEPTAPLSVAQDALQTVFRPEGQRVAVVAPHLDDELLGPGGTISELLRKGSRVHVIIATAGDAYTDSCRHWFGVDQALPEHYQEMARLRRAESLAAMQVMGLGPSDMTFLGFPDAGTETMWRTWDKPYRSPFTNAEAVYHASEGEGRPFVGQVEVDALFSVLDRLAPDLIFIPHHLDTHGDHWVTGATATAAIQWGKARRRPWAQMAPVYTYLIHWETWPGRGRFPGMPLVPPFPGAPQGTPWVTVPLRRETVTKKAQALNLYRTQLVINQEYLYLSAFIRRNELFGRLEPLVVKPDAPAVVRHPGRAAPHPPVTLHLTRDSLTLLVTDDRRLRLQVTAFHADQVTRHSVEDQSQGTDGVRRLVFPLSLLGSSRALVELDAVDGRKYQRLLGTRLVQIG